MSRKFYIFLVAAAVVAGAYWLRGADFVAFLTSGREQARIDRLLPQVQRALFDLRSALAAEGIETFVDQTARTADEQAALVAKGVSSTERSWHRLKRAVDLYPRNALGQPDMKGSDVEKFRRMHELAPQFGFRGLAFNPDGSKRYLTNKDGQKYWDGGHLEFPEGMTWAEAAQRQGVVVA